MALIRFGVAWVLLGVFGCKPSPTAASPSVELSRTRREEAVKRSAGWLAEFPQGNLHFDAAIGLSAVRQKVDSPELQRAFSQAVKMADRDRDNPMRRLFDPSATAPASVTATWEVPTGADARPQLNAVMIEAAHCAANGLRAQTLAYLTGPMRDQGGYGTTHALWALTVARDEKCLSDDAFRTAAAPLVSELRQAQPERPAPGLRELDLFAERVLVVEKSRLDFPERDQKLQQLLVAQQSDGAFGVDEPGKDPYLRYHATLVADWALAESLR